MITLYHSPQSRSVRPRWALEEAGAPYDLVRLDLAAGDHKKPEYLKRNPNGTVPTLVDGDLTLFESAAIVQYLADRFPAAQLAPPIGTAARGRYYQWIHYAMTTIEPPAITIFLHTIRRPEETRIPQLVEESKAQLANALAVVDAALAGTPYLLGAEFSAADLMIGSTLWWCQMMGLVGDRQHVPAYIARLSERPAMQRATAD